MVSMESSNHFVPYSGTGYKGTINKEIHLSGLAQGLSKK